MAKYIEFKRAFSEVDGCRITIETRSGKKYEIHEDQLPAIKDGDLIYGTPIKKLLRSNRPYVWMDPKNVKILLDQ